MISQRERKDNTSSWCNWAEVLAVKHGIQSDRLVKHLSKEGNGMLSSGNDGIKDTTHERISTYKMHGLMIMR